MAEIKATPRGEILGMIADALMGAKASTGVVGDFLLGDAPELVNDLSYGVPPWRGKGQATRVNPAVLDAVGLLPVGGAVGLAGKLTKGAEGAMGVASRSSQLGQIRPGGREDLFIGHGTRPSALLRVLESGRGELTSPSFAITKDRSPDDFSKGALLVPRLGAFDPETYPSMLFNRDAYTPRAGDFDEQSRNLAAGRLRAKLAPTPGNVRGAEGNFSYDISRNLENLANNLSSAGQASAIYDSPVFKSFKAFENSPKGANLLINSSEGHPATFVGISAADRLGDLQPFLDKIQDGNSLEFLVDALAFATRDSGMSDKLLGAPTQGLQNRVQSALKNMESFSAFDPALPQLIQKYAAADPKFMDYLSQGISGYIQDLRKLPSTYAELKSLGNVQISPEHFAGAVINPALTRADELAEALRRRNIPVIEGTTDNEYAIQLLQENAPPARKSR